MTTNTHYLKPGEFYFDNTSTRIKTYVGHGVALVMWHSVSDLGGVCHFLLPSREGGSREYGSDGRNSRERDLDGRYGDEALQALVERISIHGLSPREFSVGLFGGAGERQGAAGEVNLAAARHLVERHGFRMAVRHVGGFRQRHVIADFSQREILIGLDAGGGMAVVATHSLKRGGGPKRSGEGRNAAFSGITLR